jgi:uncharacterized protein with HEPN domain
VPHRDWKLRIRDILHAIYAALDYTKGIKYQDFVNDRKTVDAVLLNLIVIGEAACNVPDEIVATYFDIPWRDMRDMRNFVIHEYFGVSDKILWDTVQNDLPPLVPLLKGILGEETQSMS